MTDTLQPKGEDLRRAVRWIGEQGDHSVKAVEEAAPRFDLSPADEEFLFRYFAERPPAPDSRSREPVVDGYQKARLIGEGDAAQHPTAAIGQDLS